MRFLSLILLIVSVFAISCGSGHSPSVVIATVSPATQSNVAGATSINQSPLQPLINAAPVPTGVTVGGKPDPSTSASPIAAVPTTPAVASPATNTTVLDPMAPSSGKWIDVDVTRYRVQLMNGTTIVQTIQPVAVGAQINTGAYESTQTGLFHVYNKIGGLQYDPPYSTYIRDWVGFDPQKANGFHSFLVDQNGTVTDGRTGQISNGCIRTGDSGAIFAYAEVGMPVYVHL